MITSIVVTGGNAPDGKQFPALVHKDSELQLPMEVHSADQGYDDGESHFLLEARGLHSAIHVNRYRTEKKDRNQEAWRALNESPAYRSGQKNATRWRASAGRRRRTMG